MDVCQRDRERTRRVGGVLQRGCKGAAQSFEEIAVDLPFKREDQVLLALISSTKIDIDAMPFTVTAFFRYWTAWSP